MKQYPLHIVDVATRDGLQGVNTAVPTAHKIQLIKDLVACGVRTLEGGAFVNPAQVPQMRDSVVIATETNALAADIYFLVPNPKGFHLATAAGVDKWVFTLSASEKHNQSNVKQTIAQSLRALNDIITDAPPRGALTISLSAALDCPYDGAMPLEKVLSLVNNVVQRLRRDDLRYAINLADTTGRAAPDKTHRLFDDVRTHFAASPIEWGFHGHDTYGLGIANAYAAYCGGARRLEGSAGGIGGCPFAPGATGNTASEDLVYCFENMGIHTGIDLDKLVPVANAFANINGVIAGGTIRHLKRRSV